MQLEEQLLRLINRNQKNNNTMKKYILSLMMMFTLGAVVATAVPQHRHHPRAAAVGKSDTDTANQGIEAYSDTAFVADSISPDSAIVSESGNHHVQYESSNDTDVLERFMGNTFGWGAVGIFMIVILFVLLFLLSPMILIILLIVWLVKRDKNNVKLAQNATETGQPVQVMVKKVEKTPYERENIGIRNIFIGLGLTALFHFMHMGMLMGVGVLIAFMGVGQWLIGRRDGERNQMRDKE